MRDNSIKFSFRRWFSRNDVYVYTGILVLYPIIVTLMAYTRLLNKLPDQFIVISILFIPILSGCLLFMLVFTIPGWSFKAPQDRINPNLSQQRVNWGYGSVLELQPDLIRGLFKAPNRISPLMFILIGLDLVYDSIFYLLLYKFGFGSLGQSLGTLIEILYIFTVSFFVIVFGVSAIFGFIFFDRKRKGGLTALSTKTELKKVNTDEYRLTLYGRAESPIVVMYPRSLLKSIQISNFQKKINNTKNDSHYNQFNTGVFSPLRIYSLDGLKFEIGEGKGRIKEGKEFLNSDFLTAFGNNDRQKLEELVEYCVKWT